MPPLLALLAFVCLGSCTIARYTHETGKDRKLWKAMDSNPVFQKNHTGFALFDPGHKEWLCQYNAHRYFTPASNTKILTLLTSLHVLGDSIESIRYRIAGDSLIIYAMADPSFLWQEIDSVSHAWGFIKAHRGRIFLQKQKDVEIFGPGWAWDDYPYAYQVERSIFPVYGNRLRISQSNALQGKKNEMLPSYFKDSLVTVEWQRSSVVRDRNRNQFSINDVWLSPQHPLEIPFRTSQELVSRLLSDTLKKPVELIELRSTPPDHSLFGTSRDTLLKVMMQESDNFIAEQLLMQCAFYMRGSFETDSAIATAQKMILGGVPDAFQWVDGSGLSRYNLFTPRSVVWLLEQLMQLKSMDYLTEVFPAGGESGTIANWYKADKPFVFAKTGTLRNNHCLSGYLKTSRGKWLLFSFMHNNFTDESKVIKQEMEKVLRMIHEEY